MLEVVQGVCMNVCSRFRVKLTYVCIYILDMYVYIHIRFIPIGFNLGIRLYGWGFFQHLGH